MIASMGVYGGPGKKDCNRPYHSSAAIDDAIHLANIGASEAAQNAALAISNNPSLTNEDRLRIEALRGRLLKDQARKMPEPERLQTLLAAARCYEKVADTYESIFAGINAASLFFICGRHATSETLARRCLKQLCNMTAPLGPRERYFHQATKAEAYLILNRQSRAEQSLCEAIAEAPTDYRSHATTLRQFELISKHLGLGTDWLTLFRPPTVCHFAGNLDALSHFCGETNNSPQALTETLAANRVGAGYGALAAGADILVAEALLARGADLNIILPCTAKLFKTISVDPFGRDWSARFDRCLDGAQSVMLATHDSSLSCNRALDLASTMAMGMAIEEADLHCSRAIQLTVAAGEESGAFTRRSRAAWSGAGRESFHLALDGKSSAFAASPRAAIPEQNRFMATMLFADIGGFGSLNDEQVTSCLEAIFDPLGDIINTHKILPVHRASWGDGIFLVYESVQHAAEIALRMQEAFQTFDLTAYGLPETLALRIGGHYAPASFQQDPITGRPSVYGSQVSYAARIEPETLPGSVFVSEHFAAAIRLYRGHDFVAYDTKQETTSEKAPGIRLFNLQD
ncbi:MAG: adenylate/guanylate cyclase domain-containing protein [Pseudomonadota bacterium]